MKMEIKKDFPFYWSQQFLFHLFLVSFCAICLFDERTPEMFRTPYFFQRLLIAAAGLVRPLAEGAPKSKPPNPEQDSVPDSNLRNSSLSLRKMDLLKARNQLTGIKLLQIQIPILIKKKSLSRDFYFGKLIAAGPFFPFNLF